MTSYVTIGRVEDFPKGVMRAFAVGDEEIVVCNAGRRFYAFRNLCSHRGERLSDGLIEDDTVVCAYHEAVYELESGRPIEGPAIDPVKVFAVRIEGDEVQVAAPSDVDPAGVREVRHEAGLIGD